ncbi:MAG: SEC-C metal-binding domain-containing protein [Acidimicrobiales bacterium]
MASAAVIAETRKRPGPRPGRNDRCPCGSGKKFKRCCGPDRVHLQPGRTA